MNSLQNHQIISSSYLRELEASREKLDLSLAKLQRKPNKSNLQNVNNCIDSLNQIFEKTVVFLKRSGKLEDNSQEGSAIVLSLALIHDKQREIIEKIKERNNLYTPNDVEEGLLKKNIQSKILTSSKILAKAATCKNNLEKKLAISAKQAQFPETPSIENFDDWIQKMALTDSKNVNFYNFLMRIVSSLELKNHVITPEDREVLYNIAYSNYPSQNLAEITQIDLYRLEIPQEHRANFYEFLNHLINTIDVAADVKLSLLSDIEKEISRLGKLSDDQKLNYFIQIHQVLNNPFEPSLVIPIPPLCRMIQQTQNPFSKSEKTLSFRTEGLRRIRKKYREQNPHDHILISGAGPGGLMFGLAYAMQGKNFTLIETRGPNDRLRENVIILGKESDPSNVPFLKAISPPRPADIKLLEFFGITDRLLLKEKLGKPPFFTVKIGDLQMAMIEQILAIENEGRSAEELIHYNSEIKTIIAPPESDRLANVKCWTSLKAKKAKNKGFEGSLSPSLIIVTEGYKSKTRDLLGIGVSKQSKTVEATVSFFESKSKSAVLKKFEKVDQTFTALSKLGVPFQRYLSHPQKTGNATTAFSTIKRGFALLETPECQYLYLTLTKEEQKTIDHLQDSLEIASKNRDQIIDSIHQMIHKNRRIIDNLNKKGTANKLLNSLTKKEREKWYHDETLIKDVFGKIQTATKKLQLTDTKLTEREKEGFEKLINQLKNANDEIQEIQESLQKIVGDSALSKFQELTQSELSTEEIQKTIYKKNLSAVHAQIQKADTNYRQIGKTQVYVGGDAESSTEPVSGAGARMTLLRTIPVVSMLTDSPRGQNLFTQSSFQWLSQLVARSLREEGFNARLFFLAGTERLERYTDMANISGALNDKEVATFHRLYTKAKMIVSEPELQFSTEELKNIAMLKAKLRSEYAPSSISAAGIALNMLGKLHPKQFEHLIKGLKRIDLDDRENHKNYFEQIWMSCFANAPFPQSIDQYTMIQFAHTLQDLASSKKDQITFEAIFKKQLSNIYWPTSIKLTEMEKTVFAKAWLSAIRQSHLQLNEVEFEHMKKATSKIATYRNSQENTDLQLYGYKTLRYLPEAWFVYLTATLQQMENLVR